MAVLNDELTTEERIAALEKELKNLKRENEKLKKYEETKEAADEFAATLAIYRDAFISNGFTDDQANMLLGKTMDAGVKSL